MATTGQQRVPSENSASPSVTTNPLFTPREAARLLGISYPTIKQWILTCKLKTSTTCF